MAADGSIVISAEINTAKAERDLAKLKNEIIKTERDISDNSEKREVALAKSSYLQARLEKENQLLRDMKIEREVTPRGQFDFDKREALAEQTHLVSGLTSEFNRTENQVEKYTQKINEGNNKLAEQRNRAGELSVQVAHARGNMSGVDTETDKAAEAMEKLKKRVAGLAKRVFVFSVITMALRSMRTWMTKVLKTNKKASDSMAKLKGALLTLAQPLVDIVVPAFIALVDVLTKVVTTLAALFAMLMGKTFEQSKAAAEALNKETTAIEGTGEAAEEAKKSLASFDEINQLSFSEDSKGQASGSGEIQPDFNLETKATEEGLGKIRDLVMLIGGAFALWDIGKLLKDLPVLHNKLSTAIGLAMAFFGALEMSENLMDAWNNGVSFDNLKGSLMGLAALATGLFVAFGKVGAGIGLFVGGVALGITAIKDIVKNGATLENTLMLISGLLAGGLGISILTGSWIPLLVAAVAGVVVGLLGLTGHLEQFAGGVVKIFSGLGDMVMAIITLDWDRWVKGVNTLGEGLLDATTAITDMIFEDFLGLERVGEAVRKIFGGIIDFFVGVFTLDWEKAWKGLGSVVQGVCQGILGFFFDLIENILDGIQRIKNLFTGKSNNPDRIDTSKVHGVLGSVSSHVPRLATGAVIPPNRQFMAVLGDQRSGTNVEAPLETIKQALAEVMGQGGGRSGDIVLQIDGKTFARVTNPYLAKETTRLGTKLVQGV